MTFFGIFRDSLGNYQLIPILFTLLSLRYAWTGFRLVQELWQNWTDYVADPLTAHKKQLTEQVAYYVMVPLSIALHELFHALATWLFGGRIVDAGYAFFWGYVLPQGDFSAAQIWFIALAGTIANLLFGLAVWWWSRPQPAATLRFLGLRTLRFQIYFSLIFYPIFTALFQFGDWRTIYNFGLTPLLSGIIAAAHGLILLAHYLLDRRGFYDVAALPVELATLYEAINQGKRGVAEEPQKVLAAVEGLLAGRSVRRAAALLDQYQAVYPKEPAGLLLRARLEMTGKQVVTNPVRELLEEALALGLPDPAQRAAAREMLARFYTERDPQQALDLLNQGIADLDTADLKQLRPLYILYFRRQRLHRHLGDFAAAQTDLNLFRQAGQRLQIEGTDEQFQRELAALQQQSNPQAR